MNAVATPRIARSRRFLCRNARPARPTSGRELKFGVSGSEAAERVIRAFDFGPEELWHNVLLDTPDRRIREKGCALFLRCTTGSQSVLIFKGREQGEGAVSDRPPLWKVVPDGFIGERNPLRWLRRYFDLDPIDRETVDELIAEIPPASIAPVELRSYTRTRAEEVVDLEGGATLLLKLELDRPWNQVEAELSERLARRRIAEVQVAIEQEVRKRTGVVLTPGAPSKFGDRWAPTKETAPRSVALLAPLTRVISMKAAHNPILQRPQDPRLEEPGVEDYFSVLVRAFQDFDGSDAHELVGALNAFDVMRGVAVPPITAVQPEQRAMILAFKARFGSFTALGLVPQGMAQNGVELLSDHTLPALLRWMLSPYSTINTSNMDNLADLLAGVLEAAADSRWDPVINGRRRLTQDEVDVLVISTLGTDILTKGRVGSVLDGMEVAPLTIDGKPVRNFGEVRTRFHAAAEDWLTSQRGLADAVKDVGRQWLGRGALPDGSEALQAEALKGGVPLQALMTLRRRMDISGVITLVQPYLDGTHLHGILPYAHIREAVVERMGAPEELAREIYLAHLAHGANAFLNRTQMLAGLELDFERMEREGQLPYGGARRLRRLYDAQRKINRDHGDEIERAIRGEGSFQNRRALQNKLFLEGLELREALDEIGFLGRVQLLQDDLTNFSERSLAKWWDIAERDCGLENPTPAQVARQLAISLNRYFYHQFPRGADVAQQFIDRYASQLRAWGLEFYRPEGKKGPLGEWRPLRILG